ncbi:threonine synthase [Streptomyces oceani]|uniref:Threonine synthase n=1 Tax=Streptomyces oceani TaxID=1075402 RepID=A0A1E7KIJ4_9ACTN|nr:pyridoxal-phosphate dependent enzyme [Streptomyces oceani]OEV03696.1 threonine synthase [Streptomyces oceani]
MGTDSLATEQRSLADPEVRYPLWPPLTRGCPRTSSPDVSYPVEVDYDYARVPEDFLRTPAPGGGHSGTGLDRWAPLLPPLAAPGLGEGGTPLVRLADGVYVKDESRNPTWSHKDRLNRCTVSAALGVGAPGVVVASSGNHGASAAAYAARAGLRCVVLGSPTPPPAMRSFLMAYGAEVLPVPTADRWPLTERIAEEFGFHPVSNLTRFHTGHAFGAEGYKTVAYEIVADLGVPGAVFVPTGYGELLFGVWKGFAELRRLGLTRRVPRLFSCEPAAGGPLAAALRDGLHTTAVEVGATDAYGIECPVNSYRGLVAVTRSGGRALLPDDAAMRGAQAELAGQGLWVELSAAAGLAGLRTLPTTETVDGPVVCVATSSGFKDKGTGTGSYAEADPSWAAVRDRLLAAGMEPARR